MREPIFLRKLSIGVLSLFIGIHSPAQVKAPNKNPTSQQIAILQSELLESLKPSLKASSQQALQNYLAAILKAPPTSKSIPALSINDLSEKDTVAQEKQILNALTALADRDRLGTSIDQLIKKIQQSDSPISGQVKDLPPEKLAYAKAMLKGSVEGILRLRGLTKDSKKNKYMEWSELSKTMIQKIDKDQSNSETQSNLLSLAESKWINTAKTEILVDGPASFAKRDLMIKNAKESIHILTWAIYDDMTGKQSVDLILQQKKLKPNLKIRIIVDAQVAAASYGPQVKRLEDNGIEVIRWFSTAKPFVGQHRKMIIVDNKKMVAGGLNFGDVYSHKNPQSAHWRDTDLYVEGNGATEGNRLFSQIWNQQVTEHKMKYEKMRLPMFSNGANENIKMGIINHDAVEDRQGSTIMLTVLKAIRMAKTQIDIENAYIILFPALKIELTKAIKERDVKVRIFTNSGESVDEPVVSVPILRSVSEFADMGAEVYVKRGTTLHSKLMVIDNRYSMIMSYNLHPRSERLEGEMAIVIDNKEIATDMHNIFTYDTDTTKERAYLIRSSSEVQIPDSPTTIPTLRLFFDML
jgi:cardiolipin synthase A/B